MLANIIEVDLGVDYIAYMQLEDTLIINTASKKETKEAVVR